MPPRDDRGRNLAPVTGEEVIEVIRDTKAYKKPGALLVKTSSGKEMWVPHSVIHEDSEVYEMGTSGKLIVFEWFANKEGWD